VITQPDGELWNALRTGAGSRPEFLMAAATTAGDDPTSFAASEHAECVKIAEEPQRSPHRFVYLRSLDPTADPWDERNWAEPNPALGDFLNLGALRDEAHEAKNDSTKENSFRQFRLNQWVSQATRWMPMHIYRECTGDLWPTVDWGLKLMTGREVWCGLDLSAKQDLTSLCVFIPPRGDKPGHGMWWHWMPEDAFSKLDVGTSHRATQWVRAGFLNLMPGAVIDYQDLCKQIATVLKGFKVREISYDKWSGEFVRQELERLMGRSVPLVACEPTFMGMTIPMQELMSLTISGAWNHHGNPVAEFCFDNVEVKRAIDNPDLIKPVKPQRVPGAARIDAVPTAALAVGAWRQRGQVRTDRSVYSFPGRK
jgi:phage terminase large subunit-like protein